MMAEVAVGSKSLNAEYHLYFAHRVFQRTFTSINTLNVV